MLFYVGTLTREGGEGILTCRLTEDGIEKTGCYTATKDPNYLIWSALNRCLYATGSDAEEEYRARSAPSYRRGTRSARSHVRRPAGTGRASLRKAMTAGICTPPITAPGRCA